MIDTDDLPERYKATELGVLPEGWEWEKLECLCKLRKETVDPRKHGDLEYIGLEHIEPGNINLTRRGNPLDVRSAKSRFFSGDLLYGKLRPYLDKAVICRENGICSTDILIFTPKSKVDPYFLILYFHTSFFINSAVSTMSGVNHPRTSWDSLSKIIIPLPPLPEQHAIATTLRTVQEAKEKTDAVIAATKALKAAMMKHLFTYGPVPPEDAERVALRETGIGPVPEDWEIRTVNELFDSKLGKMLSPVSKTGKFSKPYLRNVNVQWGRVDISDIYEMDFSESSYDRYALIFGDVLICEGGEIGRTAIWRDEIDECYYQKAIHRLRPRDGRISPEFFSYHMMYAFLIGKTYSELGTTTTIAHLPGMKLKALLVPVPPRQVQDKIVTILESIDQKLAAEQSRKEALDTLFTSLLPDLMTAKIRVSAA